MTLRKNIVVITLIASAVVVFLAFQFPGQSDLVFALAGALVGALASIMKDLVNEPAPTVPADTMNRLISIMEKPN